MTDATPPQPDTAAPEGQDLAAVLTAAARGDEQAWRVVVDLYARRVYALARSRIGRGRMGPSGSAPGPGGPWARGDDAAEEVTQSVFVTVAAKLTQGEYTERGRFESWLFRVAMNRIRDEVRRSRRSAAPVDPETLDGSPGAEAGDHNTQDSLRALRAALERLPEADREVIELRHHAGMPFKQIADLLEEPLGTLLARHHRALRKLKDLMTERAARLEAAGEGT